MAEGEFPDDIARAIKFVDSLKAEEREKLRSEKRDKILAKVKEPKGETFPNQGRSNSPNKGRELVRGTEKEEKSELGQKQKFPSTFSQFIKDINRTLTNSQEDTQRGGPSLPPLHPLPNTAKCSKEGSRIPLSPFLKQTVEGNVESFITPFFNPGVVGYVMSETIQSLKFNQKHFDELLLTYKQLRPTETLIPSGRAQEALGVPINSGYLNLQKGEYKKRLLLGQQEEDQRIEKLRQVPEIKDSENKTFLKLTQSSYNRAIEMKKERLGMIKEGFVGQTSTSSSREKRQTAFQVPITFDSLKNAPTQSRRGVVKSTSSGKETNTEKLTNQKSDKDELLGLWLAGTVFQNVRHSLPKNVLKRKFFISQLREYSNWLVDEIAKFK